jgi:hypothetical protein
MQRGDEHRDAEAQPGRTRRCVGKHLKGRDLRRVTDYLLHRPCALEAEFFSPREIVLDAYVVKAVVVQLGDGDRKPHGSTLGVIIR